METNRGPTLQLQLRPRTVATPNLEGDWAQFLHELIGADCAVAIHEHDRYPFHAAGDFQHKPIYHEAI